MILLALPSSSVFPGLSLNQPSVISNMLNRAVAFLMGDSTCLPR